MTAHEIALQLLVDLVVYGVIVTAVVIGVANAALWSPPSITDGDGTEDDEAVDQRLTIHSPEEERARQ